jgi:hypothetical protein
MLQTLIDIMQARLILAAVHNGAAALAQAIGSPMTRQA